MTSFITHMCIGIILSEILLRFMDDDTENRKDKRFKFWFFGALGGAAPDLDVIPTLFTNLPSYTFHHYFTHTFFAVGIVFLLVVVTKFNPFMLAFFLGYFFGHFWIDWLDNSISPLGPFDFLFTGELIEWGMLARWGPMPITPTGSGWLSEYWLYPQYANHDLWTIFLNNGWGIPFQFGSTTEFYTYYDMVFTAIGIPLILGTFIVPIKRRFSR